MLPALNDGMVETITALPRRCLVVTAYPSKTNVHRRATVFQKVNGTKPIYLPKDNYSHIPIN